MKYKVGDVLKYHNQPTQHIIIDIEKFSYITIKTDNFMVTRICDIYFRMFGFENKDNWIKL